jgi:hypothetical protein
VNTLALHDDRLPILAIKPEAIGHDAILSVSCVYEEPTAGGVVDNSPQRVGETLYERVVDGSIARREVALALPPIQSCRSHLSRQIPHAFSFHCKATI